MKCFGFIFARGGSKGVPDKNIKLLGGKPLISYAVDAALKSEFIDRVFVSTEDEKIAEIASKFGAEVPFVRPMELASDLSSEILSWKHAVKELKKNNEISDEDIFISIPCTSPFRESIDIDNCINSLLAAEADIAISITNAHRHPSFNMVKKGASGYYELVLPLDQQITRRQDAPKIYDITTVCYAAKVSYVAKMKSLLEGKVSASIVPEERALDIDTQLDFKFAEFILQEKM